MREPPPPDGIPRPRSDDPEPQEVLEAYCRECGGHGPHRRFFSTIWGAFWAQCLGCGKERPAG